jgi:hypothetical protein
MTNTDSGNTAILEEIANSVATVYKWKDYYLPEIKKVVEVDISLLEKYAGKYDFEGRSVTFKRSDKDLLMNVEDDQFWNVFFTSDNEFFIREFRGSLRFQTDDENKVTGFVVFGRTARKIED